MYTREEDGERRCVRNAHFVMKRLLMSPSATMVVYFGLIDSLVPGIWTSSSLLQPCGGAVFLVSHMGKRALNTNFSEQGFGCDVVHGRRLTQFP